MTYIFHRIDSPVVEPFIPPSPSQLVPRPEVEEPPTLPPSPDTMPFTYAPGDRSIMIFHPRRDPRRVHWEKFMRSALRLDPRTHIPDLRLHYQLCYNSYNPALGAEILWDITQPPDYARVPNRSIFKRFKTPDILANALEPTVQKAWILTDTSHLAFWMDRWGPIIVRAESVTIGDILRAIYAYLRVPLTPQDLEKISRVPGNRRALRFARAQRAKDSYNELEAVVVSHGYRRVDVLGGHRKFQGLRVVILPDRTWRLYLGLCPGPVPRVI